MLQAIALPPGENLVHALEYAEGWVFTLARTAPATVRRLDAADFRRSVAVPLPGSTSAALDMQYVPAARKLYACATDKLFEIEPGTMAVREVMVPWTFAGAQSIAFDDTFLYLLAYSRHPRSGVWDWSVGKLALADLTAVPDVFQNYGFILGHSIHHDGAKLFVTKQQQQAGGGHVARIDPATLTLEQSVQMPEAPLGLTDDCASTAEHLWVGSEGGVPSGLFRVLKSDLTQRRQIPLARTDPIWTTYFDGEHVWATQTGHLTGNLGQLVRVDPATLEVATFAIPREVPNGEYVAELRRDGDVLYASTYASPSSVMRIAVPT